MDAEGLHSLHSNNGAGGAMTRSRLRKLKRARPELARTAIKMLPIASAIFTAIHPAFAQQPTGGGGLEEIVVTAQKRAEDLQSVPLSIVAIGTEQLEQLNIQREDDYIKYLPSVTSQKSGSGGGANGPVVGVAGAGPRVVPLRALA